MSVLTYTCPECLDSSPREEWRPTCVGCEDCGDHPALVCPLCEEVIDMVMRGEDFPDWSDRNYP